MSSIDLAHSAIQFSVRHMMFAKVRGKFDSWNADLTLDPHELVKSGVEATIDAGSIDTGVADRDKHLRSADFLDVEKYPQIRFKSTAVEKTGGAYRVKGDLTIRDTTRPVTLEVETLGTGKDPWGNQRMGFSAKTSINRKDFGLSWNQALETGGVLVGEEIKVEIETEVVLSAARESDRQSATA
jgi:polyisoprenoid-binding protein YceI